MVRVRNMNTLALTIKLPAVERAGDAAVFESATDTEMRTQMSAVSVQYADFIFLVAKGNQLTTKVMQCFNVVRFNVIRTTHGKPAGRKRGEGITIISLHTGVFIQKISVLHNDRAYDILHRFFNTPAVSLMMKMEINNSAMLGGLLMLSLLLLMSCVHQQDALLIAPERFKTTIYDNGIKQFQLQMVDEKQKQALINGKEMSPITQKRIEALLLERLEIKLRETNYCRQGYILSKEFSSVSLGDFIIKGECVEGASPEDRRLFPNE